MEVHIRRSDQQEADIEKSDTDKPSQVTSSSNQDNSWTDSEKDPVDTIHVLSTLLTASLMLGRQHSESNFKENPSTPTEFKDILEIIEATSISLISRKEKMPTPGFTLELYKLNTCGSGNELELDAEIK
ncbi:hypothetical protein Trydic_g22627 [Trypoxylus dichotomus]